VLRTAAECIVGMIPEWRIGAPARNRTLRCRAVIGADCCSKLPTTFADVLPVRLLRKGNGTEALTWRVS